MQGKAYQSFRQIPCVSFLCWYAPVPVPLLFSVELDEEMSILGIPFRYMFLLADKENFKTLCREYEVDKETEEKCLCDDTDCIVIYTGMSLQG